MALVCFHGIATVIVGLAPVVIWITVLGDLDLMATFLSCLVIVVVVVVVVWVLFVWGVGQTTLGIYL